MSTRLDLRSRLDCPTVVATEVLLLRPRGVPGSAVAAVENTRWPVFVMAVAVAAAPATRVLPLFELLDPPRTSRPGTGLIGSEDGWMSARRSVMSCC